MPMAREKQRELDEQDREEIEALLREIDLLLQHIIMRVRERDSRIFKKRSWDRRTP